MRPRVALLTVLFMGLFGPHPALAARRVALRVESPPALTAAAAEIGRLPDAEFERGLDLTGLPDGGGLIRVVLAPEESDLSKRTPRWIAGFAEPAEGLVVLFPARAPVYPDDGIRSVLRHEVTHVLVYRASRGGRLPRWFHEGVAMLAGRSWNLEDRTRFAFGLIGGKTPLWEVEALFEKERRGIQRAYAVSGAFVQDLLTRYGDGLSARVLRLVAEGRSFEGAFEETTGAPLSLEEDRFWARERSLDRWLPELTSTFAIWVLVTLLAVYAIRKRRAKDRRMRRRWELEEEMAHVQDERAKLRAGEDTGSDYTVN